MNNRTSVSIWDAETGDLLRRWKPGHGRIHRVRFLNGTNFLVTGGEDNAIRIWETASGIEVYRLETPETDSRTLNVSEDGRYVALSASMQAMAERDYEVTGFDLSHAMLEYASEKTKKVKDKITLFHADMTNFKIKKKVDAAYSLVSTFKYLLDEESALAHLQRMAKAIKKATVYI